MKSNNNGFLYPVVDKTKCIDCGLCDRSCPVLTQNKSNGEHKKAIAVQAKDGSVVEKSSSGGAFYLLASEVINEGGYVCGVEVDKSNKIRHTIVNDFEGLERLLGSKYVQSEIGETYTSVKALLNSGKKVMFSGTPCQVNGLLSFLGAKYKNLLTVDVICHGVSSPYVWDRYMDHQERKHCSKVVGVNFRKKTIDWKNSGMELRFENGQIYFKPMKDDAFFHQFLKNLCLRETCYACEFKGHNRNSDITIGDFWGKDELYPELDGDRGYSLIIANTDQAKAVIEANSHLKEGYEVELVKALKYNGAYWDSVEKTPYRNDYIKSISRKPFDKATNKYLRKISIKRRMRYYFKKIKLLLK